MDIQTDDSLLRFHPSPLPPFERGTHTENPQAGSIYRYDETAPVCEQAPFQTVKKDTERGGGVEGEPSGFPSPRRAKRITRPQAVKVGRIPHFCSACQRSMVSLTSRNGAVCEQAPFVCVLYSDCPVRPASQSGASAGAVPSGLEEADVSSGGPPVITASFSRLRRLR